MKKNTAFKMGDVVWSQRFGCGHVTRTNVGAGTPYVIEVTREGIVPRCDYFTYDGQYDLADPDPDCNIHPITDVKPPEYDTEKDIELLERGDKKVEDNTEEELKVGDWVWLNPNEKGIITFIYPNKEKCIVDSELDGEVEAVMAGLTKIEYSPINPSHYQVAGIPEAIDIMKHLMTQEQFKGFLWGNIIKYAYRYGRKGDEHDTAGKIEWYANRLKEVCAEEKKEQKRE